MAAVVLYGPNGLPLNAQLPLVVDPATYAARVCVKPDEYQHPGYTGGHYRAVTFNSTNLAFLANAPLLDFFFQPTNNNLVAVITRIRIHFTVQSSVTFQRIDPVAAYVRRIYTTQVTNGASSPLSGNNVKMRSSMGTCQAKLKITTTAAGLSGGSFTQDDTPFAILPLIAAGNNILFPNALGTGSNWQDIYKADDHGDHPLTLQPSEGFVVQWGGTALATGTLDTFAEVEWHEALQF